ncbi:hypothetical protein M569_09494 [Genlisea aurea]|uniref:Leucine-rich repeat-containing N-terminal plant-type domain-containing protein n=1 Tax=Genlisea aurea TaxID=192259 RepID=S8CE95_9LAMI|nr:hypothetical protein M569_09494 [Genlisea aurea]
MNSFTVKHQQWILFPLCVLLLYGLPKENEALSSDGQALVNFRNSVVNSDGVLLQWRPEDEDPCGWRGVKCDSKSKRVTGL